MYILRVFGAVLFLQTCLAASQWETARLIGPAFSTAFSKCNQTQETILFAQDNVLPYVACFDLIHQAPQWVGNLLLDGQADDSGRPDIDPWISAPISVYSLILPNISIALSPVFQSRLSAN
jgi:hypothetical protein